MHIRVGTKETWEGYDFCIVLDVSFSNSLTENESGKQYLSMSHFSQDE